MSDSLKFGTSGLRGLATELEGPAARSYVAAFLRHCAGLGALGAKVYIGRDFRASSPAIAADCAAAVSAMGLVPVDCGTVPTPALALHAMAHRCPAIMVTGSHIPEDRNGLKFYLPTGEISKDDEAGILAHLRDDPIEDAVRPSADEQAATEKRYLDRWAPFSVARPLWGLRVGVFQHSTVMRDLLVTILERAGAAVVPLGRREGFVAVDTEAFGDAVFAPLRGWIDSEKLDAIVSADGDGDRPLVMDGAGSFVRGDVLGLLAARLLGAQTVITPVTSNSAIERTGFFPQVVRTRVGSPYVVAAMEGAPAAVGFEANGGTLVGPGHRLGGAPLEALPTRDAVLPILAALALPQQANQTLAELVASLPLQHALADRLPDVPSAVSGAFLQRLRDDPAYAADFFGARGIAGLSDIDGLQFRTSSGDMVHFRASGNAPELRCYVEGASPEAARELLDWGMSALRVALR
jgi:phosphomannomutase